MYATTPTKKPTAKKPAAKNDKKTKKPAIKKEIHLMHSGKQLRNQERWPPKIQQLRKPPDRHSHHCPEVAHRCHQDSGLHQAPHQEGVGDHGTKAKKPAAKKAKKPTAKKAKRPAANRAKKPADKKAKKANSQQAYKPQPRKPPDSLKVQSARSLNHRWQRPRHRTPLRGREVYNIVQNLCSISTLKPGTILLNIVTILDPRQLAKLQ